VAKSIRTTVSIPANLYSDLAKAAESSHVSTAWVIREALRVYFGGRRRTDSHDTNVIPEAKPRRRRTKNG
jgi:metal-responsive CopG/Arc/MetJ family transcriptional regulator